jgi:deoxyribonuclease V
LVARQLALGREAASVRITEQWTAYDRGRPVAFGGCFLAFARGEAGPGHAGDRGWAAAVVWSGPAGQLRKGDRHLQGVPAGGQPRRADDVLVQAVVTGRVGAAYAPGLLALREGPILAAAVAELMAARPGASAGLDVLLVDATGADHPRRAGLAVHLGAVTGVPTIGVTHRPLVAVGELPGEYRRGATAPVTVDGERVGYWVCTRDRARPVVAHAGWRTTAETAVEVTLAASTPAARTPVPLQEARRVAREARALADHGG